MALVLKDRISETTTTTGTGTITLGGATPGFQPFSSIGDTNTTYYCVTSGAAWEVGIGTYASSGNTLARTTILANSNNNTSPITLGAGTKTVFSVYPADRAVVVDGTTIQIPNNAVLPVANGGTGSNTATFSGENITSLNATAITAGTIANNRTTASSSNGASTIVQRDASGDFSANIITANSYSGSGASLTSLNASSISSGTLGVANGGTGSSTASFSGANITSLNASSISSGTLGVANGGTGATTLTANNVLLGNGTSAVQVVAPGTSGNVLTSNGTTWTSAAAAASVSYGLFYKANPTIVAWTKTGNGTATTGTTIYVEVNGSLLTINSGTSITMPALSAGTDYAIWAKPNGTLEATSNFSSPPVANSRLVGGFHYAPGGNATAQSGGDTTAQINAYSFWDLKFRPVCSDPRGMTLVADSFWADIYLCGVDYYTNGTSKYNVTIADGSSLPKISAAFGGNGSNTYALGSWFAFNEIMQGVGKRLPAYTEACAFAYGTTEGSAAGTDPNSTILRAAYTSKWGVMLASGNIAQWLRDFIASGNGSGGWQTNQTELRGSIYTYGISARAGTFGNSWGNVAVDCGSRGSNWGGAPSNSIGSVGARGVCDHLQLN